MARSLPALTLAAAAALLATAPAAHAHSLVRVGGGVASYISVDEVSLNTLTVSRSGDRIEFRDPPAYQGLDVGPCEPGEIRDDAFPIQAFCSAAGVTRVRIELGNREDTATVTVGRSRRGARRRRRGRADAPATRPTPSTVASATTGSWPAAATTS